MDSQAIKEQKTKIRKEIIQRRNAIAPPDMIAHSKRICNLIMAESRYLKAKDILLYMSYSSEVKTDLLFETALKEGKNVYFPKITNDEMDFYKVTSFTDFATGYKGISEPFCCEQSYHKSDSNSAIIIVPGCVFGRDGYRIGYGKGYYDRFLARYPGLYKIGICYSVQMIDSCPCDSYDIQMDEIICEKEILTKSGKGEARWI